MLKKVIIVWMLGLLTIVPYGTYYLFFQAERSEYAFVIVSVLFWIFGFWGVAGPLISAWKVRQLFKLIEKAHSADEMARLFQQHDGEETVVELLASENNIPKFLARRLYRHVAARLRKQT